MAKTKSFKSDTNPAMSFISQESIDKVDGKQEGATTPTGGKREAPEGYKPNPEYIETKSRRVQLLVQPSVYEAVKAKAKANGTSTNEAINEALREYTAER
jgi:hypothetical protein